MTLPEETPEEFWMLIMRHKDTGELLWKQALSEDMAEKQAREETYHTILGVRKYVADGDYKAEKTTVQKTVEEEKLVSLSKDEVSE